jgi:single-strand DNA-binding protein
MYISGRLQTDSWEDEQSGEKRSKTKVVAMDMILLDPKGGQIEVPASGAVLAQCLNRVQVIGNVTRDPELRTTTSGQNVLSFGIATNERWKDKASGEMKERTEFHNIVAWGDLAVAIQANVKKGQRVYACGRVQTRSFETQAGQKRFTTEVIADQVNLLGVKNADAVAAVAADGAAMSAARSVAPARKAEPVAAGVAIPEIKYESEIKPEDLPF